MAGRRLLGTSRAKVEGNRGGRTMRLQFVEQCSNADARVGACA